MTHSISQHSGEIYPSMGTYWLLHSQSCAVPKRSRWRGATFETMRRTFVKVAVRVKEIEEPHQARLHGKLFSGRSCS